MLQTTVCCDLMQVSRVKERACQLFEVCQHGYANLSLPCEGRFRHTREIARPFVKLELFSAAPRATFIKLLSCSSSSQTASPTRETLAEYGLNSSMCKNASAGPLANQNVYIPQINSLKVYTTCFIQQCINILDDKLYWYCLALHLITKAVFRAMFAVKCSE